MAVAYRAHNVNISASSTTATFIAPSTVVAGDVWMCALSCRGGTGNTFGTLPTGFTQISRLNNGTVSTLAVFKYTCLGSETAGASFATLTVGSTARVNLTDVAAFSGADAAGIVAETGTANATASATQSDTSDGATGANDAIYFAAMVPASTATANTFSANLSAIVVSGLNGGTSTAANTAATARGLGAFASGTTFSNTFGSSGAGCAVSVRLPATAGGAAAPVPARVLMSNPAVVRAATW